MDEYKPCLIDRNKIPFRAMWIEADAVRIDIGRAKDFGEALEVAEEAHKTICDILNGLQQAEVVDAVPVVRCKDCKFCDWDSEPNDAMVCMRTKDGFWRSGNDFCSYGERKEGADNEP